MKKNKLLLVIILLLIVTVTGMFILNRKKQQNQHSELFKTDQIVTTMDEQIGENTMWCGSFQLVWNELKGMCEDDKVSFLGGNTKEVNNLNKGEFTTKDLDENSYYIKRSVIVPGLKEEIEKSIKDKFNEKSDILDDMDFTPDPDRQIIYAMLLKNVEFPKMFQILDKSNFKEIENVKYFGIRKSDKELENQVKILYFVDEENFAIELKTKSKDRIILETGSTKTTFKEIYEEVMNNYENYDDNLFVKGDVLEIPYLEINAKQRFEQFTGKEFVTKDQEQYIITDVIQTIRFKIDERGAKLKSESAIMIEKSAIMEHTPRIMKFNKDFTLFMLEEDKNPYLAIKVNDIKQYQNIK